MSKSGTIAWRELMSPKPEDSERFYSELFAWKIKAVPFGPTTYRLVDCGPKQIAGIMQFDKAGIPPHWVSYVNVDDVDATAKLATDAGGRIGNPPTDIPNVGRFAVLLDPMNAVTVAFKSANPSPESTERPVPGEFCWEQTNTTDPDKAAAFYEKVYGWKATSFDADPRIKIFTVGDKQIATMMQAPPGVPAHWLTYVAVAKLAEARDRVKRLGGKIMVDEIPVPKMGVISVIQDNVGAALGLFESQM